MADTKEKLRRDVATVNKFASANMHQIHCAEYVAIKQVCAALSDVLNAATPPADAALPVPIEWRKIVRELMTVANFRPLCQKNVMEGCRCYDCVMQRAGELIDAQLWNN